MDATTGEAAGGASAIGAGATLGVVIITYNSADVLPGLLDSLAAGLRGAGPAAVIVVDNASSDGSADIAAAHPLAPRLLRSRRNGGFAAGINAAAAVLPARAAMLILNPDIRLDPGSIGRLVSRARAADVGVVVPRIRNEDGSTATSLRREPSVLNAWTQALFGPVLAARLGIGEMIEDTAYYAHGRDIEWATGAILLVTARARQRVGAWDEGFFLYSEEVDFQRRVRDHGLRVVYEPAAEVMHIGGKYLQQPGLTALMTSNKIRYFGRHHGPISRAAFRAAMAVFALLRVWRSPSHRAMLAVALSPLRPPGDYVPGLRPIVLEGVGEQS